MSKAETYVRSFGMSGMLVTDELRLLERKLGLDLGHVSGHGKAERNYYSQFEMDVRKEASQMARHYELFYCLENAIRKLISETLREQAGAKWWESGLVPSHIGKEVRERIQRDLESGMTRRSDDPLDYTTFGELSGLITSNWNLFQTILSSKRGVERVLGNLNLLRGPIAHCCALSEDEIVRLELSVKDWFRAIG